MILTNQTKRLLLSGLLLLLVNGAALGCGAFALGEGAFADNPVAAAFPALLSLLLIVWQPWLLLLCLIPGGPYAAALVAVPATLALYRTGPGQRIVAWLRGFAWRLGPKMLAASLGGFLLIGALVTLSAYKDYPVRHHGLPPARMLPFEIRVGGEDGKAASPYALTDSRYYTLSHFIDDECLWKVRVPRAQLFALENDLGLKRVSMETLPDTFWKQPPYWWTRPDGVLEAYQTPDANFKRGEGWHADAVYDPQTQYLYVWGENNF